MYNSKKNERYIMINVKYMTAIIIVNNQQKIVYLFGKKNNF